MSDEREGPRKVNEVTTNVRGLSVYGGSAVLGDRECYLERDTISSVAMSSSRVFLLTQPIRAVDLRRLITMIHDEEMEQVVQEFLELIHKFSDSSAPLYREVVEFIKQKSNQIRRSHPPSHVEAPVDAPTRCNDRTKYPAEKCQGTGKRSQADRADTEDNRTQQNSLGVCVQDQGKDQGQGRLQAFSIAVVE